MLRRFAYFNNYLFLIQYRNTVKTHPEILELSEKINLYICNININYDLMYDLDEIINENIFH